MCTCFLNSGLHDRAAILGQRFDLDGVLEFENVRLRLAGSVSMTGSRV